MDNHELPTYASLEPRLEPGGSMYVTIYKIQMWKNAKRYFKDNPYAGPSFKRWLDRLQTVKDVNDYICEKSGVNPDYLEKQIYILASFWDFKADSAHQPKSFFVVSKEQLSMPYWETNISECSFRGKENNPEYFCIDHDSGKPVFGGTYEECRAYEKEITRQNLSAARKKVHYEYDREGLPDKRKGRDVTAEEIKNIFRLAGLTVSDSLPKKDQKAMLNALYDSLSDITYVLGIKPEEIGFGGRLSVGLGKNCARNALAVYQPSYNSIVIGTSTKGGTFIHEYFHAMEYNLVHEAVRKQVSLKETEEVRKNSREVVDSFISITKAFKDTQYMKDAASIDPSHFSYWTSDTEMFARAGEAFFEEELNKINARNTFIVNTSIFRDKRFPKGEEKERLCGMYRNFLKKGMNAVFPDERMTVRKMPKPETEDIAVINLKRIRRGEITIADLPPEQRTVAICMESVAYDIRNAKYVPEDVLPMMSNEVRKMAAKIHREEAKTKNKEIERQT